MKIRNISGIDLEVPALGRMVEADSVVEIDDDDTDSYVCQESTWEAAEPTKRKK